MLTAKEQANRLEFQSIDIDIDINIKIFILYIKHI